MKPETAAETRRIVLKEVGAKWGKFSLCGSFGIEPKNPADDMVARVLSVRLCELKGIDFDGYDPPDD